MKLLLAIPQTLFTRSGYIARWSALALLGPALLVCLVGSAEAADIFAPSKAVADLQAAAGTGATLTSDPATGLVRHLSAAAGSPVAAPGSGSESRARGFLRTYGGAFTGGSLELATESVRDGAASSNVRFSQTMSGVPVSAGAVHVQLNDAGILNVSANTLADPPASLEPTLNAAAAAAAALAVVVKGGYGGDAKNTEPRLEVFNRGLIERQGDWPTRLAWFVEVSGATLREYVWIDAADGRLLLNFSQLNDAKSWQTYDSQYVAQFKRQLIWTDGVEDAGEAIPSDDDDNADLFVSQAYDFFANPATLNFPSFDGADATIFSNVNYCPSPVPLGPCGYENAFWAYDSVAGEGHLVYGEDFPDADDVVAHEFSHGVIEFTSNLFYYGQSGAMNESYADVFGEVVDLSYGVDAAPDRWLMGEDLPPPVGAIRNMMTPQAAPFYDPPSTQSNLYYCGNSDQGGVHTNSGVGNRAFALFVDGNGGSITGIGDLGKASEVYFDALQALLPTSTWADNYAALNGACTALIGGASAITAGDCNQLQLALDAVRMNTAPCALPTAAACPAGETRHNIFADGFENLASGNWAASVMTGVDHWGGGVGTPDIYWADSPRSGSFSAWALGFGDTGDSALAMASGAALPLDARAMFWGDFQFESSMGTAWDGGVVEYSTNGGSTWMDAGPLISGGMAYNGTLDATNPLGARPAFTAASGAYVPTVLDLTGLAGENFKMRFRVGTDAAGSDFGWFVDDVGIFRCIPGGPTDWNNDVYPDIFWNNHGTGANRIWTMKDSARTGTRNLPGFPNADFRVGAVADFDQDGTPDLVATDTASDRAFLVLMKSSLSVKKVKALAVLPAGWRIAAAGDFNNDGFPDIVARNPVLGVTVIAYWNGRRITKIKRVNRGVVSATLKIEAAGDMDRDGDPDLLWRDYGTGNNWVQFMNNNKTTGVRKIMRIADTRAVLEQVSDFNLDGHMDLLWRHYGIGRSQIWYMKGTTRTGRANIPAETDLDWNIEN